MPKAEPEEVYVVDPTFRPDPVTLVGNIRTDGTGDEHRLGQHPVFVAAEERRKIVAARALDPTSPIDRGIVILPGGNGGQIGNPTTDEEARDRIATDARLLALAKPEVVTPDLRDGEVLLDQEAIFSHIDEGEDEIASGAPVVTLDEVNPGAKPTRTAAARRTTAAK